MKSTLIRLAISSALAYLYIVTLGALEQLSTEPKHIFDTILSLLPPFIFYSAPLLLPCVIAIGFIVTFSPKNQLLKGISFLLAAGLLGALSTIAVHLSLSTATFISIVAFFIVIIATSFTLGVVLRYLQNYNTALTRRCS